MYSLEDLKKLPEANTLVKHHFSDSVYIKEMTLDKGCIAMSHKHTYSHLSVVSKGSCIVTTCENGLKKEITHTAPSILEIKAGIEHQIEAIEDVVWLCIHGTNEKDYKKIDEVAIGSL